MSVTVADIQGMPSGEFASLGASVIQPFIDEAERIVGRDVWGELADDGVRYLAAHLLAVVRRGSSAPMGPVISETAGPVSRSYAAPSVVSTQGYNSTLYGQRFQQLVGMLGLTPGVL
jgi:hypothetical protein